MELFNPKVRRYKVDTVVDKRFGMKYRGGEIVYVDIGSKEVSSVVEVCKFRKSINCKNCMRFDDDDYCPASLALKGMVYLKNH